jgi:hypothetical protein
MDLDAGLRGACNGGHLQLVVTLLSLGARGREQAAVEAWREGHLDVIEYMIGVGCRDFVTKAEAHPKVYGSIALVRLLVDRRLQYLQECFMEACRYGFLDVVRYFVPTRLLYMSAGFRLACVGGHRDVALLIVQERIFPYSSLYHMSLPDRYYVWSNVEIAKKTWLFIDVPELIKDVLAMEKTVRALVRELPLPGEVVVRKVWVEMLGYCPHKIT